MAWPSVGRAHWCWGGRSETASAIVFNLFFFFLKKSSSVVWRKIRRQDVIPLMWQWVWKKTGLKSVPWKFSAWCVFVFLSPSTQCLWPDPFNLRSSVDVAGTSVAWFSLECLDVLSASLRCHFDSLLSSYPSTDFLPPLYLPFILKNDYTYAILMIRKCLIFIFMAVHQLIVWKKRPLCTSKKERVWWILTRGDGLSVWVWINFIFILYIQLRWVSQNNMVTFPIFMAFLYMVLAFIF